MSAQVKVEDPPGEALPNSEIVRRLSRAVGCDEPELYESDRAIVDELLERTGLGIDWPELARRGNRGKPDRRRAHDRDRVAGRHATPANGMN